MQFVDPLMEDTACLMLPLLTRSSKAPIMVSGPLNGRGLLVLPVWASSEGGAALVGSKRPSETESQRVRADWFSQEETR